MAVEWMGQLNDWSRPVLSWLGSQTLFSAIVFALVWGLARILRLRDPYWLTALWALIPIRLLLPPSFYSPVALSTLFERILGGSGVYSAWPETAMMDALQDSVPAAAAGHGESALLGALPWTFLLSILWLCGVAGLTILYTRRARQRRRLMRNARIVDDPQVLALAAQWAKRLDISLPPRLLVHEEMMSPFTAGWRRPVICLPSAFLHHKALESILAHEMAHIKRRDSLALSFQSVLLIVYFFDPLLWFANRNISFYRECLCDRLALRCGRLDPLQYGTDLLQVLSVMAAKPGVLCSSPALGHYHKDLALRFHLLKGGIPMRSPKKWYRIILLLVLIVTILPFARSGESRLSDDNAIQGDGAPGVSESQTNDNSGPSAVQFVNPLPSHKVNLGSGPARDPFNGEAWKHIGVDLAAPSGEAVKSCADGTVVDAVEEYTVDEGRGRYVTVQHADGFSSRYSHLLSISVKKGDQIHAGDVIARVGSTGRSTGSHLHFELLKNDEPVDPQEYIEFKK